MQDDDSPAPNALDSTVEFITRALRAPTIEAVRDLFRAEIARYGFNASVCGEIAPRTLAAGPPRFFFNDWPATWTELYLARGYIQADFVVSAAQTRTAPFTFSEVLAGLAPTPRLTEMSAELRAFGWREGLGVPVHGPGGYAGLVTMVGTDPAIPPDTRARLHMLAFYAHERCRQLDSADSAPRIASLTPRELECLRWVAAGKSDWEASRILGIARTTVKFHVDAGKAKLGVRTRSQAAALLALHGLV